MKLIVPRVSHFADICLKICVSLQLEQLNEITENSIGSSFIRTKDLFQFAAVVVMKADTID